MYLNTETVGAVEVEVLISDDNQSAYSTNKGEKGIVQTNQLVKSKYQLPWNHYKFKNLRNYIDF